MIRREWSHPRLVVAMGLGAAMVAGSIVLLLAGTVSGWEYGRIPLQVSVIGVIVIIFGASGFVSMRVFER